MTWIRLLRRRGVYIRVMSLMGNIIFFLFSIVAVGLCKLLSTRAKISRNMRRTRRKAKNWKQKVAMKLLLLINEKFVA